MRLILTDERKHPFPEISTIAFKMRKFKSLFRKVRRKNVLDGNEGKLASALASQCDRDDDHEGREQEQLTMSAATERNIPNRGNGERDLPCSMDRQPEESESRHGDRVQDADTPYQRFKNDNEVQSGEISEAADKNISIARHNEQNDDDILVGTTDDADKSSRHRRLIDGTLLGCVRREGRHLSLILADDKGVKSIYISLPRSNAKKVDEPVLEPEQGIFDVPVSSVPLEYEMLSIAAESCSSIEDEYFRMVDVMDNVDASSSEKEELMKPLLWSFHRGIEPTLNMEQIECFDITDEEEDRGVRIVTSDISEVTFHSAHEEDGSILSLIDIHRGFVENLAGMIDPEGSFDILPILSNVSHLSDDCIEDVQMEDCGHEELPLLKPGIPVRPVILQRKGHPVGNLIELFESNARGEKETAPTLASLCNWGDYPYPDHIEEQPYRRNRATLRTCHQFKFNHVQKGPENHRYEESGLYENGRTKSLPSIEEVDESSPDCRTKSDIKGRKTYIRPKTECSSSIDREISHDGNCDEYLIPQHEQESDVSNSEKTLLGSNADGPDTCKDSESTNGIKSFACEFTSGPNRNGRFSSTDPLDISLEKVGLKTECIGAVNVQEPENNNEKNCAARVFHTHDEGYESVLDYSESEEESAFRECYYEPIEKATRYLGENMLRVEEVQAEENPDSSTDGLVDELVDVEEERDEKCSDAPSDEILNAEGKKEDDSIGTDAPDDERLDAEVTKNFLSMAHCFQPYKPPLEPFREPAKLQDKSEFSYSWENEHSLRSVSARTRAYLIASDEELVLKARASIPSDEENEMEESALPFDARRLSGGRGKEETDHSEDVLSSKDSNKKQTVEKLNQNVLPRIDFRRKYSRRMLDGATPVIVRTNRAEILDPAHVTGLTLAQLKPVLPRMTFDTHTHTQIPCLAEDSAYLSSAEEHAVCSGEDLGYSTTADEDYGYESDVNSQDSDYFSFQREAPELEDEGFVGGRDETRDEINESIRGLSPGPPMPSRQARPDISTGRRRKHRSPSKSLRKDTSSSKAEDEIYEAKKNPGTRASIRARRDAIRRARIEAITGLASRKEITSFLC